MIAASKSAKELGLGINTVHDLDPHNLKYFKQNIPWIDEVSIGHPLICDASIWVLKTRYSFTNVN